MRKSEERSRVLRERDLMTPWGINSNSAAGTDAPRGYLGVQAGAAPASPSPPGQDLEIEMHQPRARRFFFPTSEIR